VLHLSRRLFAGTLTAVVMMAPAACAQKEPAAATGRSVAAGASPAFGGTDLAWIEITIAMNEQLLPLLGLAPAHAGEPAVRTLAADLASSARTELSTLRMLHDQAGLPAKNPHEGMPMPGMVTADQVAGAARARGAGFDALLVRYLRGVLDQGVNLATSETRAGVEPRTRALAERVLASRAAFLPRLQKLTAK
jgi:uncharacterized protein (DUF305 family)